MSDSRSQPGSKRLHGFGSPSFQFRGARASPSTKSKVAPLTGTDPDEQAPMLETVGSDLGRQWEHETTVRVMTAYVAHELNHPLGTIINLVNTLSRNLARPVVRPQEIEDHLRTIKAEAVRATTTIKHLRLLTERRPTTKSSVCLIEAVPRGDRPRPAPGRCQADPDPSRGSHRSDTGERRQGIAGNGDLQFPDQQRRGSRRPVDRRAETDDSHRLETARSNGSSSLRQWLRTFRDHSRQDI